MIISKIKKVRDALNALDIPIYHFTAKDKSDRYIVWAEDMEGSSLEVNNQKANQSIQGTIDFFTKDEYDTMTDEIQSALNNAEISFSLNSIQYEDETEYIHFEWVWEVI